MTDDEIHDFLRAGTRTGHLATTRADGRPHVKPVWFVLDGTPAAFTVVFTTGADTVAGRNLARDPRLAMSVDDPVPPFAFVQLQGTAELVDDVPAVRAAATSIAARYMGEERAAAFGERNGVPGELLVRVTVLRSLGMSDVSG